jgi:hypothetical protein
MLRLSLYGTIRYAERWNGPFSVLLRVIYAALPGIFSTWHRLWVIVWEVPFARFVSFSIWLT